jgi:hypothetical protein
MVSRSTHPIFLRRYMSTPVYEQSRTYSKIDNDVDGIKAAPTAQSLNEAIRRRKSDTRSLSKATSVERAVSSIFVLGKTISRASQDRQSTQESTDYSSLSPEELGGVEYRALRVLLKVAIGKSASRNINGHMLTNTGYFVGLHLFGVVCLVPWIHNASPKYQDYLASIGQDKTWWYIFQHTDVPSPR